MRPSWIQARALAVCCLLASLNACGEAQTRGAGAAPASIKLQPAKCKIITAEQRAWLAAEWQPFLAFVKTCEVKRAGASPLYVVSVWADEYEAHLPQDAPAPKYPKPVIVSVNGKTIGRLPLGFPRDPPRGSDVTFTKWSEGFPQQIRVEIDDPTVTGNSSLMLEWNAQENTYVQAKAK